MKELSIEEKAKAYDKVAKEVKDFFEGKQKMYSDVTQTLEYLFPELKESEDERIRKWLIRYFNQYIIDGMPQVFGNGLNVKDVIVWLEKRGEQKQDVNMQIEPSEYINDMGGNGCYLKNDTQKPADKVEPKFKIEKEKWYVCTHTYVLRGKIVVIKGQTYQAEKDNVIKGEDGCLFIDRHDGKALDYFRSWTIQDAKDGDVLLSPATPEGDKECPFIFKEIDKNGIVRYHVALLQNKDFKISNDVSNVMGYANAGYHVPATKEQRDLLFQKMKEAGYEWDAEEKELKKIEQKPVDVRTTGYWHVEDVEKNPTWSKEDNYVFERLFCLLHNEQDKYPQQSSEFQELEEIENKLKSFKYRLQPQSKWSEEDDKHLQIAINYTFSHGYLSTVDWLRTLKDRMQPKQEWKQENTGDLTDFENAMMHIGGSFFEDNAGLDPNDTNAIKEQANLLLELVPKQEWSEEDEKILSDIITSMTNLKDSATSDALRDIYNSKIDWLKSLRPQNTWKPSDEQITWLYRATDDASKDSRMKQVLNELLFDLKKLREE